MHVVLVPFLSFFFFLMKKGGISLLLLFKFLLTLCIGFGFLIALIIWIVVKVILFLFFSFFDRGRVIYIYGKIFFSELLAFLIFNCFLFTNIGLVFLFFFKYNLYSLYNLVWYKMLSFFPFGVTYGVNISFEYGRRSVLTFWLGVYCLWFILLFFSLNGVVLLFCIFYLLLCLLFFFKNLKLCLNALGQFFFKTTLFKIETPGIGFGENYLYVVSLYNKCFYFVYSVNKQGNVSTSTKFQRAFELLCLNFFRGFVTLNSIGFSVDRKKNAQLKGSLHGMFFTDTEFLQWCMNIEKDLVNTKDKQFLGSTFWHTVTTESFFNFYLKAKNIEMKSGSKHVYKRSPDIVSFFSFLRRKPRLRQVPLGGTFRSSFKQQWFNVTTTPEVFFHYTEGGGLDDVTRYLELAGGSKNKTVVNWASDWALKHSWNKQPFKFRTQFVEGRAKSSWSGFVYFFSGVLDFRLWSTLIHFVLKRYKTAWLFQEFYYYIQRFKEVFSIKRGSGYQIAANFEESGKDITVGEKLLIRFRKVGGLLALQLNLFHSIIFLLLSTTIEGGFSRWHQTSVALYKLRFFLETSSISGFSFWGLVVLQGVFFVSRCLFFIGRLCFLLITGNGIFLWRKTWGFWGFFGTLNVRFLLMMCSCSQIVKLNGFTFLAYFYKTLGIKFYDFHLKKMMRFGFSLDVFLNKGIAFLFYLLGRGLLCLLDVFLFSFLRIYFFFVIYYFIYEFWSGLMKLVLICGIYFGRLNFEATLYEQTALEKAVSFGRLEIIFVSFLLFKRLISDYWGTISEKGGFLNNQEVKQRAGNNLFFLGTGKGPFVQKLFFQFPWVSNCCRYGHFIGVDLLKFLGCKLLEIHLFVRYFIDLYLMAISIGIFFSILCKLLNVFLFFGGKKNVNNINIAFGFYKDLVGRARLGSFKKLALSANYGKNKYKITNFKYKNKVSCGFSDQLISTSGQSLGRFSDLQTHPFSAKLALDTLYAENGNDLRFNAGKLDIVSGLVDIVNLTFTYFSYKKNRALQHQMIARGFDNLEKHYKLFNMDRILFLGFCKFFIKKQLSFSGYLAKWDWLFNKKGRKSMNSFVHLDFFIFLFMLFYFFGLNFERGRLKFFTEDKTQKRKFAGVWKLLDRKINWTFNNFVSYFTKDYLQAKGVVVVTSCKGLFGNSVLTSYLTVNLASSFFAFLCAVEKAFFLYIQLTVAKEKGDVTSVVNSISKFFGFMADIKNFSKAFFLRFVFLVNHFFLGARMGIYLVGGHYIVWSSLDFFFFFRAWLLVKGISGLREPVDGDDIYMIGSEGTVDEIILERVGFFKIFFRYVKDFEINPFCVDGEGDVVFFKSFDVELCEGLEEVVFLGSNLIDFPISQWELKAAGVSGQRGFKPKTGLELLLTGYKNMVPEFFSAQEIVAKSEFIAFFFPWTQESYKPTFFIDGLLKGGSKGSSLKRNLQEIWELNTKKLRTVLALHLKAARSVDVIAFFFFHKVSLFVFYRQFYTWWKIFVRFEQPSWTEHFYRRFLDSGGGLLFSLMIPCFFTAFFGFFMFWDGYLFVTVGSGIHSLFVFVLDGLISVVGPGSLMGFCTLWAAKQILLVSEWVFYSYGLEDGMINILGYFDVWYIIQHTLDNLLVMNVWDEFSVKKFFWLGICNFFILFIYLLGQGYVITLYSIYFLFTVFLWWSDVIQIYTAFLEIIFQIEVGKEWLFVSNWKVLSFGIYGSEKFYALKEISLLNGVLFFDYLIEDVVVNCLKISLKFYGMYYFIFEYGGSGLFYLIMNFWLKCGAFYYASLQQWGCVYFIYIYNYILLVESLVDGGQLQLFIFCFPEYCNEFLNWCSGFLVLASQMVNQMSIFLTLAFYLCKAFGTWVGLVVLELLSWYIAWWFSIIDPLYLNLLLRYFFFFGDTVWYEIFGFLLHALVGIYGNCIFYLILVPFIFSFKLVSLFVLVFFKFFGFMFGGLGTLIVNVVYLAWGLFLFNISIIFQIYNCLGITLSWVVHLLPIVQCLELIFYPIFGLGSLVEIFFEPIGNILLLCGVFAKTFVAFCFFHLYMILSGLSLFLVYIADFIEVLFPNLVILLDPFGGISIMYAAFYYYLLLACSLFFSRAFRVFATRFDDEPVPDLIWRQEYSKIQPDPFLACISTDAFKLINSHKVCSKTGLTTKLYQSFARWALTYNAVDFGVVRIAENSLDMRGRDFVFGNDVARRTVRVIYKVSFSLEEYLYKTTLIQVCLIMFITTYYILSEGYMRGYEIVITEDDAKKSSAAKSTTSLTSEHQSNEDLAGFRFELIVPELTLLFESRQFGYEKFKSALRRAREQQAIGNLFSGYDEALVLVFPILGHFYGKATKEFLHRKSRVLFLRQSSALGSELYDKGIFKSNQSFLEQWRLLRCREMVYVLYRNINDRYQTKSVTTKGRILGTSRNRLYNGNLAILKRQIHTSDMFLIKRYEAPLSEESPIGDFDLFMFGLRLFDFFFLPLLMFASVNTAWYYTQNGMYSVALRMGTLLQAAEEIHNSFFVSNIPLSATSRGDLKKHPDKLGVFFYKDVDLARFAKFEERYTKAELFLKMDEAFWHSSPEDEKLHSRLLYGNQLMENPNFQHGVEIGSEAPIEGFFSMFIRDAKEARELGRLDSDLAIFLYYLNGLSLKDNKISQEDLDLWDFKKKELLKYEYRNFVPKHNYYLLPFSEQDKTLKNMEINEGSLSDLIDYGIDFMAWNDLSYWIGVHGFLKESLEYYEKIRVKKPVTYFQPWRLKYKSDPFMSYPEEKLALANFEEISYPKGKDKYVAKYILPEIAREKFQRFFGDLDDFMDKHADIMTEEMVEDFKFLREVYSRPLIQQLNDTLKIMGNSYVYGKSDAFSEEVSFRLGRFLENSGIKEVFLAELEKEERAQKALLETEREAAILARKQEEEQEAKELEKLAEEYLVERAAQHKQYLEGLKAEAAKYDLEADLSTAMDFNTFCKYEGFIRDSFGGEEYIKPIPEYIRDQFPHLQAKALTKVKKTFQEFEAEYLASNKEAASEAENPITFKQAWLNTIAALDMTPRNPNDVYVIHKYPERLLNDTFSEEDQLYESYYGRYKRQDTLGGEFGTDGGERFLLEERGNTFFTIGTHKNSFLFFDEATQKGLLFRPRNAFANTLDYVPISILKGESFQSFPRPEVNFDYPRVFRRDLTDAMDTFADVVETYFITNSDPSIRDMAEEDDYEFLFVFDALWSMQHPSFDTLVIDDLGFRKLVGTCLQFYGGTPFEDFIRMFFTTIYSHLLAADKVYGGQQKSSEQFLLSKGLVGDLDHLRSDFYRMYSQPSLALDVLAAIDKREAFRFFLISEKDNFNRNWFNVGSKTYSGLMPFLRDYKYKSVYRFAEVYPDRLSNLLYNNGLYFRTIPAIRFLWFSLGGLIDRHHLARYRANNPVVVVPFEQLSDFIEPTLYFLERVWWNGSRATGLIVLTRSYFGIWFYHWYIEDWGITSRWRPYGEMFFQFVLYPIGYEFGVEILIQKGFPVIGDWLVFFWINFEKYILNPSRAQINLFFDYLEIMVPAFFVGIVQGLFSRIMQLMHYKNFFGWIFTVQSRFVDMDHEWAFSETCISLLKAYLFFTATLPEKFISFVFEYLMEAIVYTSSRFSKDSNWVVLEYFDFFDESNPTRVFSYPIFFLDLWISRLIQRSLDFGIRRRKIVSYFARVAVFGDYYGKTYVNRFERRQRYFDYTKNFMGWYEQGYFMFLVTMYVEQFEQAYHTFVKAPLSFIFGYDFPVADLTFDGWMGFFYIFSKILTQVSKDYNDLITLIKWKLSRIFLPMGRYERKLGKAGMDIWDVGAVHFYLLEFLFGRAIHLVWFDQTLNQSASMGYKTGMFALDSEFLEYSYFIIFKDVLYLNPPSKNEQLFNVHASYKYPSAFTGGDILKLEIVRSAIDTNWPFLIVRHFKKRLPIIYKMRTGYHLYSPEDVTLMNSYIPEIYQYKFGALDFLFAIYPKGIRTFYSKDFLLTDDPMVFNFVDLDFLQQIGVDFYAQLALYEHSPIYNRNLENLRLFFLYYSQLLLTNPNFDERLSPENIFKGVPSYEFSEKIFRNKSLEELLLPYLWWTMEELQGIGSEGGDDFDEDDENFGDDVIDPADEDVGSAGLFTIYLEEYMDYIDFGFLGQHILSRFCEYNILLDIVTSDIQVALPSSKLSQADQTTDDFSHMLPPVEIFEYEEALIATPLHATGNDFMSRQQKDSDLIGLEVDGMSLEEWSLMEDFSVIKPEGIEKFSN